MEVGNLVRFVHVDRTVWPASDFRSALSGSGCFELRSSRVIVALRLFFVLLQGRLGAEARAVVDLQNYDSKDLIIFPLDEDTWIQCGFEYIPVVRMVPNLCQIQI